jgi:hypothetical protein
MDGRQGLHGPACSVIGNIAHGSDRLRQPIAREKHYHPSFDFDTDHSIEAVDVEIKISKAGSGSGRFRNRY